MGLLPQATRFLLREHQVREITGRFLFIGRQTTYTTLERALSLISQESVVLNPGRHVSYDDDTRAGKSSNQRYLSDFSLISHFSKAECSSLDVSQYENATIICDLNQPVSPCHRQQFDFIYNGSCLDNIFNPAQALINITDLLAPGGRVLNVEHGTRCNNPYTTFNPAWFFDYYALNHFIRWHIFIAAFSRLDSDWSVFELLPCIQSPRTDNAEWSGYFPDIGHFLVVSIAERGEHTSDL